MFANPFSPIFGGRPGVFFGRNNLRKSFEIALSDRSSEDRALFITGTSGSGKTTLLELFSRMAAGAGWKTVDLVPDHIIQSMLRALVDYDEKTTSIDPQVSISILGSGGSVGGVSTAKTRHLDEADLAPVFLEACQAHPRGIMVSIDEIQKVSEADVSVICNAFQLAIRKGYNAILVIAGLPYSHREVISYEGCTFMRRAHHVQLTLLSRAEATSAFAESLSEKTEGIRIKADGLTRLVQASYGHPYMLQLLGYYLVTTVNESNPGPAHTVSADEVTKAIDLAVSAYEMRALQPLVAELKPDERRYLRALASVLDERRMGKTSDVMAQLGIDAGKASYLRKKLLDHGIVLNAGHGSLTFNIPYLASYILQPDNPTSELERVMEWQL